MYEQKPTQSNEHHVIHGRVSERGTARQTYRHTDTEEDTGEGRHRHRDTQAHTSTSRNPPESTQTYTPRHAGRHAHIQRQTHMHSHVHAEAHKHKGSKTDTHTHAHTYQTRRDRRTHRRPVGQADRQADKWTGNYKTGKTGPSPVMA